MPQDMQPLHLPAVQEALGLEAVGAAKGRSRSDRRVTETLLNSDVVNLKGDCVDAYA